MGAVFEFNWMLKLTNDQIPDLSETRDLPFKKKGTRIYPIGIPIDLVNENWEAIARCVITSFKVCDNNTIGTYKILKPYSTIEKEVLTQIWRDTLCYSTKDYKIVDYSKKHIT